MAVYKNDRFAVGSCKILQYPACGSRMAAAHCRLPGRHGTGMPDSGVAVTRYGPVRLWPASPRRSAGRTRETSAAVIASPRLDQQLEIMRSHPWSARRGLPQRTPALFNRMVWLTIPQVISWMIRSYLPRSFLYGSLATGISRFSGWHSRRVCGSSSAPCCIPAGQG